MKPFTYYISLLLLFCLLVQTKKGMAQCTLTANFSTLSLPGGQVQVTSTSVGTNSTASYYWSFGPGANPSSATGSPSTTTTFTINGTYTISLFVITATPSCASSKLDTVVVTTSTLSNSCTPSLTYSTGTNGTVYFTAVTPTASPSGTLSWNFGNGLTDYGTSTQDFSNYSSNGVYTVTVIYNVNNPGPCSGTTTAVVTVTNVCTPSLLYVTGPTGVAHFTITPPSPLLNSNVLWNFGNGSIGFTSSITDSTLYLSNGTYYVDVSYTFNNPTGCSGTIQDTILITTAGCNLTASLTASSPTSTTIYFTNISTGITSVATVTLDFGDGSPVFIGPASMGLGGHTYSSTGTYFVILKIDNNSTPYCADTTYLPVVIGNPTAPCGLTASFSYTNTSLGNYNFSSNSIGATANATYYWNFGDSTTTMGTFSTVSHPYSTTGPFQITLTVDNNVIPTCISTPTSQNIYIPCIFAASFSHTVTSGGLVDFESTSTGTLPSMSYLWIFGDGSSSTNSSVVTHQYINAGAYEVKMMISDNGSCTDSTAEFLNITGITCTPNAYFTLSPSSIPHYWDATPTYPWNVIDASWDWGDGSVSDSLYTSHAYSTAGTYSICLSVTVSCGGGATGTECSSQAIFKIQQGAQDQSMVYVNVKRPSQLTGLPSISANEPALALYPNPNSGLFQLKLDGLNQARVNISIYNLIGKQIYTSDEGPVETSFEKNIKLDEVANGVYFVKITSPTVSFTKKMIINR